MPKEYPRSDDNVQAASGEPLYISYGSDEAGRQDAMKALGSAIEGYSGRVNASQRSRMGFDPGGVGGDGISGRYGLTNDAYEIWRPSERSRFHNIKQTIIHSDMCYARHGLIKNIIDLMSDFASQGIRLVHPNRRIEKFYQNWFRKVQGPERSERFLNNFYRLGNVVVRYQTAKVTAAAEKRLYKTSANTGAEMDIVIPKVRKREIPWKYVFLHPATVEIVGGALANFVGDPMYAVRIPLSLTRVIKSPRNDAERAIADQLPAEIRQAAETNKPVLLPQDRTRVFNYKKDDWEEWGSPMISSILIDISLYEKLKLADRAALDGAISNIRIFKLGSLEHKIVPGEAAVEKLASILSSNTEAGTLDLIWGPDIELIESKTSVHQFLGMTKYEPTLIAIYAGLGIPPTLTGTFGAGGTTNNFISLKTLTQRLEYGRDALVSFWNEQARIVQEAMGFRFPARVEFDMMNLGDEAAEKALLIQLADRNLISDEMVQRHFDHDPEMERIRIKRENQEREAGRMVPKAGAFHDPMFEDNLKKVFAQTGVVTPSEMGIELLPKKKGEKAALEMRQPTGVGTPGKKPGSSTRKPAGRPKNSKDSGTRKTKTFRPKTKASLAVWARAAQEVIAETLNPIILEQLDKSSMRSLSSEEFEQSEKVKFGVLCNMTPLSEISEKSIHNALAAQTPPAALTTYGEWTRQIVEDLDRQLTTEERRNVQAHVYAALKGEDNGSD
jgi:hypothetical protein